MMNLDAGGHPRGRATFDAYDVASAVVFAGLIALVLLTYDSYSISNDEAVQHRYGELIIRYYASGFAERDVFTFENLYLYGGLFDVVAVWLASVLPFDQYSIRHLLCAAIGIGGIAATWATARMVAGTRAGLIAAMSLAVCGPWYGGMFNHTKDVTFAAAMMGAIFMLLRVMRELPRPRLRDVLIFGALLGAALGLRALGLLLLTYVALAIVLQATGESDHGLRPRARFVARSFVALIPAFVLGYTIMIAAWPWASLDLFNPVRALFEFSRFHYPIRTLLAGHVYDMAEVPHWYVPAYVLIKLPLIMHGGFVVALILACCPSLIRRTLSSQQRRDIGLIAFAIVFPLICHVASHGPAFTGLRHFLFVVPPIAVLAGIGWDILLCQLSDWRVSIATGAAAAITAALLWNASLLIRLHPHEHLFFNQLVGGLQGAATRYDTDYWVNIMSGAVRDLDAFLARTELQQGRQGPYYVTACAERFQFEHIATPRMRWTDNWERADFYIGPTHMGCDHMLQGKVITRIERLGTLIGVIKDRRAITRPELTLR